MFIIGAIVTLLWVFCFFYYGDMRPRNWSVGAVIVGLASMGWGLLRGRV